MTRYPSERAGKAPHTGMPPGGERTADGVPDGRPFSGPSPDGGLFQGRDEAGAPPLATGAPEWAEADPFFDISKAASATECTGLMPAMTQTDAQSEALAQIEAIHKFPGAIRERRRES